MESLETVDQTYQKSLRVRQAYEWLASKQKSNGGWGEHYSSCERQENVQHEDSQVVNTAGAVLALMSANYPQNWSIERGIEVG